MDIIEKRKEEKLLKLFLSNPQYVAV